jgi:putative hydrolase of the HAD superfamily
MPTLHSWIIFDADNTLWEVESLYDAARRRLCEYVERCGHDAAQVQSFQQERDKELYRTYGYSACRFARSFEDTLLHYIPTASDPMVRDVRGLALAVFTQSAAIADAADILVESLVPRYKLGIVTAGEKWVQERRIGEFPLRSRFTAIEVVESKDMAVFTGFCERNRVERASSWVIGDSLKSDIIPAVQAGLNAVLVNVKNWRMVEHGELEVPAGVVTVKGLRDLLKEGPFVGLAQKE